MRNVCDFMIIWMEEIGEGNYIHIQQFLKAARFHQSLNWTWTHSQSIKNLLKEALEKEKKKNSLMASINIVLFASCLNPKDKIPDEEANKLYEKVLESTNSQAQVNLSWLYKEGQGISIYHGNARRLSERAKSLGNHHAMNLLGIINSSGLGIVQDFTRAKLLFEEAIINGNVYAIANLGDHYEIGKGVGQDYKKAKAFYEQAIEQGNEIACTQLAKLYRKGLGIEKDCEQEAFYNKKASDLGHYRGMYNLAIQYIEGQGVEKDTNKAIQYFQSAAAFGFVEAVCYLGEIHRDAKDDEKAVEFYKIGAELGHNKSKYNLAYMYELGKGVVQDYHRAAKLYKEISDNGVVKGTFRLAKLYHFGRGVNRDLELAEQLYQRAIDAGHTLSLSHLGVLYMQDKAKKEEGIRLLKRGMDANDISNSYLLGLVHMQGIGAPQSFKTAAKLFNKASDQGHLCAKIDLAYLYETGRGVARDVKEAARLRRVGGNFQGLTNCSPYSEYHKALFKNELPRALMFMYSNPELLDELFTFEQKCKDSKFESLVRLIDSKGRYEKESNREFFTKFYKKVAFYDVAHLISNPDDDTTMNVASYKL